MRRSARVESVAHLSLRTLSELLVLCMESLQNTLQEGYCSMPCRVMTGRTNATTTCFIMCNGLSTAATACLLQSVAETLLLRRSIPLLCTETLRVLATHDLL